MFHHCCFTIHLLQLLHSLHPRLWIQLGQWLGRLCIAVPQKCMTTCRDNITAASVLYLFFFSFFSSIIIYDLENTEHCKNQGRSLQ